MVTDTHFGRYKNNPTFLESQLKFFNEQFFPYLEKNKIDTIVHLGDIFENRNNVNINVLNAVDKLIENQFSKYNTYFLVGNHDSYFKTSIDVNSVKTFRKFKNITVVDDITRTKFGDKSALLVSWRVDKAEFMKKVANKNIECNLCFGHFEINGFNLNNAKTCDFGIDPEFFMNNFDITFSGHFHGRKLLEKNGKKVQYIGNAYQLTRGDIDAERGFCILDTDTMKYEFINNEKSIQFKKFKFPEKFTKEDIEGNSVDVIVDVGKKYKEKDLQKYMMFLEDYKPFQAELKLENNVDVTAKGDYKIQSTEDLIEEYINDTDFDDDTKKDVNEKMIELYKECKGES